MKLIQVNPQDKKMLKEFIRLTHDIYKDNPYWVPPLERSLANTLINSSSMQLRGGPFSLFMVEDGGKYIARLLVGVNEEKNKQKNQNEGYFSLFESVNNIEVARLLFNGAFKWLNQYKVDMVTGPVSPTNGDDFRGVLITGFDQMPAVNTTYTMDYYKDLFDQLNFEKYLDFHAFKMNFNEVESTLARVNKLVEYGKKKINLSIEPLSKDKMDRDVKDVYDIFIEAQQSFWDHLEVPSYEKFYDEFKSLKPLLDPKLIYIARVNGLPAGFIAGLPDYNQVLSHLKGKLSPISLVKFLYYKNRINRARMFMQFVIPKYQKSVVTPGLYAAFYEGFVRGGYKDIEASTIAEFNIDSLNSAKGVGFETSRIYRIYKKDLV
jgi:hypothetical protein